MKVSHRGNQWVQNNLDTVWEYLNKFLTYQGLLSPTVYGQTLLTNIPHTIRLHYYPASCIQTTNWQTVCNVVFQWVRWITVKVTALCWLACLTESRVSSTQVMRRTSPTLFGPSSLRTSVLAWRGNQNSSLFRCVLCPQERLLFRRRPLFNLPLDNYNNNRITDPFQEHAQLSRLVSASESKS